MRRGNFKRGLELRQKKGLIQLLYRGQSKEMAFRFFNLDPKYNQIEQYKNFIFYYGDKACSFWCDNVKFDINEISEDVFNLIFDNVFSFLKNKKISKSSEEFYRSNKESILFFQKEMNKNIFLDRIRKLDNYQKFSLRNNYFKLLHQLEIKPYKEMSVFVSASLEKSEAYSFAGKNGIIIYFWSPISSEQNEIFPDLPFFIGDPIPAEQESSILGAIFPHYIYAFEYKEKIHYNPKIDEISRSEVQSVIQNGFEINQEDFKQRAKDETNYRSYVQTDGDSYEKIDL